MDEKKVLVTGGCGFIGSNLANRLLKLGEEVVAIDNMSKGGFENLHTRRAIGLRPFPWPKNISSTIL